MSPKPTGITLHRDSRVLEIVFNDGRRFLLSCEYLRVHSPSVEVRGLGELEVYKEDVSIVDIQPVGSYAIRLFFDDGYKSGIYSWEHLYDLGVNREAYWSDYLGRLERAGYTRRGPARETPENE